jgi:hypothetical protein
MKRGLPLARIASTSVALLSLSIAGLSGLFGVASGTASAQSVAQSYIADTGTMAGMIVRIDDTDGKRVKAAQKTNINAIHGVVVLPNDAPLSLSEATNERQVFVATSGTYKVLVSDENGPIRKDDFIAVSSIDGIGMQANPLPNVVVGKSLSLFDGKSNIKSQITIKDSEGRDRVVSFGYVEANINVTRNPLVQNTAPNLPPLLQKAAEGVADKPVSPIRIYISVIIMIITTIIVIFVLVTGIRSSVIALGRNPLARSNILRNLIQVVMIGLMILIVGLFAVYLLLKL